MQMPQAIGRYRIEGVLGAGAMGIVYRGHDPDIDRPVAIKLIRTTLLEGDGGADYTTRFRNEAKLAGRCVHPNIVGVYDFATHEGSPFLVLEYVDGTDLTRAFPAGYRATTAEALRVGIGVLDALAYAHGFGIVHRDIKPANILLTKDAALKVTDFGISRLNVPGAAQSAVLIGTPSYMAPEQCRGDAVDGRCDLFSLGCVLHEMLAGERLFAAGSYAETIYRLTHEPHRPLGLLRDDIPAELSAIIDRALAKQPEARFGDAAEMAAALRKVPLAAGQAVDEQATVVVRPQDAPRGDGERASGLGSLESASLATVERRLALHIGPLAGFHLRRALRDAGSIDELCRMLGETLSEPAMREAFIQDARGIVAASATARAALAAKQQASAEANSTALTARLERALLEVMGPIAPRLIARAHARATDPETVAELCEAMIPLPAQRARFRRILDG